MSCKKALIALSGKAGVGKSSIAAALALSGFVVVSFAEAIRAEVADEYSIPVEVLKSRAKDVLWLHSSQPPMPRPLMTLRDVLRAWGAYRRDQDPNYIIDKTFARLAELDRPAVIDDLRLRSEAHRIRDTPGAFIVRIDPHACWDPSRSSDDVTETDLDDYSDFDLHYQPALGPEGVALAAQDILDMSRIACGVGECALS